MEKVDTSNPTADSIVGLILKFNEVCNRHNVDEIMQLMTEDCIFENTRPAPDGERIEGQQKVREFWEQFFKRSPQAHFTLEEIFSADERCVTLWRYDWIREGKPGHVRGTDIFRIQSGKIKEKLSYVKG